MKYSEMRELANKLSELPVDIRSIVNDCGSETVSGVNWAGVTSALAEASNEFASLAAEMRAYVAKIERLDTNGSN